MQCRGVGQFKIACWIYMVILYNWYDRRVLHAISSLVTASSSEAGSSVAFFWFRIVYPDITCLSGPDIFAQIKQASFSVHKTFVSHRQIIFTFLSGWEKWYARSSVFFIWAHKIFIYNFSVWFRHMSREKCMSQLNGTLKNRTLA